MVRKKVVCILGMHRSGTSMLTRAINLMGVDLGPEESLIEPGSDNPEGFWENGRIVQVHRDIMEYLDYKEHDSYILNEYKLTDQMTLWENELRQIVESDFKDSLVWGWKDPRTCLLLPVWDKLFENDHLDIYYVFIYRNPDDVANSLNARNQLSKEKARRGWLSHNLAALTKITNRKHIVVSYDEFLENPLENSMNIAQFLGLPLSDEMIYEIKNSIKPKLRHSKYSYFPENRGDEADKLFGVLERLRKGEDVIDLIMRQDTEHKYNSLLFEIEKYESNENVSQLISVSSLYIDSGAGFSEKESFKSVIEIDFGKQIRIEFHLDEELPLNYKLRWDPAEGQKYSIIVLSSGTDNGKCIISPLNAVCSKRGVDFFDTTDPMYDVRITSEGVRSIYFDLIFLSSSTKLENIIGGVELPDCFEVLKDSVEFGCIQTKQIEEQNNSIEEQRGVITEQNRILHEQSVRIKEQNKAMEEQSSKIEEQSSKIEEQSSKIEEQSSKIEEQSSKIEEQSSKIEEQSKKIEEQSKKIEEQTRALDSQYQLFVEQQHRLEDHQNTLKAIYESNSWKFACIIRKMTGFFMRRK